MGVEKVYSHSAGSSTLPLFFGVVSGSISLCASVFTCLLDNKTDDSLLVKLKNEPFAFQGLALEGLFDETEACNLDAKSGVRCVAK